MNICKGVVIAMIEIKLLVNDIDYEKTAETLLPALAEHMRENGGALSALSGLFSMPGSFGTLSAKAILSKMSPSSKDELIAKCLLENKDKLISMLETAASDNGLVFKVKNAEVKAVK